MPVRKEFHRAVAEYRAAVGMTAAARELAPTFAPELPGRQRQLITQLAQAATVITPGWLGQALTRAAEDLPLGQANAAEPLAVRIGQCNAGGDYSFPVVVNLLGTGHLFIDADVTDHRVSAMVRSVLLRLLAARGTDSCQVSLIDPVDSGEFERFHPLVSAGLAAPVATGRDGLERALAGAEAHLSQAANRSHPADMPERLVVVTGLPSSAGDIVTRFTALAARAVQARLHLIVAGWPGPAVTRATHVSAGRRIRVAGVAMPVDVDPPPSPAVIASVCQRLAAERSWLTGEAP